MPPLMGTKGAASAQGFGFTLSSLGPGSWALTGLRETNANGIDITRGMAVSVNGIMCIMSSFQSGTDPGRNVMRFFNSEGISIFNTTVNSYYDGPVWGSTPKLTFIESHVNNNSLTAPIFYPTPSANYYNPYGCGAFYHNTTTPVWTNNPWQFTNTGFNYGGACQNVVSNSNGDLYIAPLQPTLNAGKFTAQQAMAVKLSPTGANTWAFRTPGTGSAPDAFWQANYAAVRTDDRLVVAGLNQLATDRMAFYVLSPSGAIQATYNFARQVNTSHIGGIMIDPSNNIYIGSRAITNPFVPRFFRFNSSYAAVDAYEYVPGGSSSSTSDNPTFHLYDGKIYSFAQRASTTQYALTSINATTMLPEWTLNITLGGFDTAANSANTIGELQGKRAVTATSQGIYLAIFGRTPAAAFISLVLKVPLDGNLTTSSKAISVPGQPNLTITSSKVTSGATMTTRSPITLSSSTGGSVTFASTTWNPQNGGTPGTASTPATSLTILP